MQRSNLTEELALKSHIPPAAARAAGSYVGDAFAADLFPRLVMRLHIGTLAGAGTIQGKFQHNSGSVSSDSNWADIDSTNCITSAFASTSNNKVGQLELRAAQHSAILAYVRPYVVAVTSTWLGAATVDALPVGYTPATSRDHADVVQTVVF
jgi:hypothetical protein